MIKIDGIIPEHLCPAPQFDFEQYIPISIEYDDELRESRTFRIGRESVLEMKCAKSDGAILRIDIVNVKNTYQNQVEFPNHSIRGMYREGNRLTVPH